MTDRSLIDIHRIQIDHRITGVVAKLRRLADTVEREAKRLADIPGPGATSFVSVVADVQHEVSWAVANLNLPELTRDAAEADRVRVEETTR